MSHHLEQRSASVVATGLFAFALGPIAPPGPPPAQTSLCLCPLIAIAAPPALILLTWPWIFDEGKDLDFGLTLHDKGPPSYGLLWPICDVRLRFAMAWDEIW